MFPVEYEAEVFNSLDGKMENIHGITFADSFTEAMDKIEDYYGEELNKVTIVLLEEATVYEISKE